MPLIVMGLSHATFSEGGRKVHLGYNDCDFVPEKTFCGISGSFAFNGPESIDEQWINHGGIELCQKCAKAGINQLRQQVGW
ncbi:hypothetical protein barba129C_phanotate83 [Rheinheimera phage vB_RspM_barba_12-9C]|nr:hypothetical protein barba129C_phanotate83 [Rheinheimera phage vB_RspM_barba_12-9C]